MNRIFFSYALVATLLSTTISFKAVAGKDETGAIVGAIVGGLLGNQIGKGDGRAVATGIGIIVGAIVGQDIGQQLDQADRRALAEAQRDVFLRPIGEQSDWDGNQYGSRTGSRGHFRTTREGYRRNSSQDICREYESVIVTRKKTERRTGIACSRGNGSWTEVTTTEVMFRDGNDYRRPTPRPVPRYPNNPGTVVIPNPDYDYVRPTPIPEYGAGYASLSGFCSDYDHQQFYQAKSFAYSSAGLNLTTDQATQWALNYNQTHRCNTINEYSNRFQVLYSMAYSSAGLNMDTYAARSYAAQKVETVTVAMAREIQTTVAKVKSFAYASNGLNKDSYSASRIAQSWVERRSCGNANQVQMIWDQYSKEFSFAYSSAGLNMDTYRARSYALDRISYLSRCSDLLR